MNWSDFVFLFAGKVSVQNFLFNHSEKIFFFFYKCPPVGRCALALYRDGTVAGLAGYLRYCIHISWLLVIILLVPLLRSILHIHLLLPAFSGHFQYFVQLSSCPISGVNSVTGFFLLWFISALIHFWIYMLYMFLCSVPMALVVQLGYNKDVCFCDFSRVRLNIRMYSSLHHCDLLE